MKLFQKKLRTYLIIVALAFLCAMNYQLFVFPNQFAPAGLNGICTMFQYLSGFSFGYLSLVINIPLAIWVAVRVSRPLACRTMLYVACFSIFLIVFDKLGLSRFAYITNNGTSRILGPLVAGIITGRCYSLLVRCSASGGGTDFVAAVIHQAHPEKNFFWVSFSLNILVALCSYFVYDYQIEPVLLCILYCFMSSTVSDHLLKGGRGAIRCEIITDYPQEISQAIIHQLHHTATLIPGTGMYYGKETSILLCVVNKVQLPLLVELTKSYPNTFTILSGANEVVGNFKRINVHGTQERELLDRGDGAIV